LSYFSSGLARESGGVFLEPRYAGRLLAIDRPEYAELIDKRSKADGPEGFLEGHLHCAVFRQRVKYPFCIHGVIDAQQRGETLWLFILLGKQGRRPSNGKSSVPFTFRRRSGAVETATIFLAAGISITPGSATPFIEPI